MGVPKFFRYMSERYPCLSELVKDYQIPDFDNLYLDMNGIIHVCSHPNDFDPLFRITEEKIFASIFHYIEILFNMIKPRKLFFMAVDGVAPRAKMNQQRGRRFRSAKEAEVLEKKALDKGEKLPDVPRFDSNCITPGTVFMDKLQKQLQYFITNKISNDPLWQQCTVILSGHETPGEGEHKIMDYIRYLKTLPEYDSNTRHCLYGLDADLIMLGLCTHEPHFSLLREEVKYGKQQNKRISSPEETKFYLLHLSLMREYLDLEFQVLKTTLPFEYNLENVIDDWVLMGFLVGNDFIPHLPDLHINKGALPILYKAYIEVLPTLTGYLNENGFLNLPRFQTYMERLGEFDMDTFEETYADLKAFEEKTGRKWATFNGEEYKPTSAKSELDELIKSTNQLFSDTDDGSGSNDEFEGDTFLEEFCQHKRAYYRTKLDYEKVDDEVMKSQAEGYIRALQWNLHYYYHGCKSWSWYYPHHYSPYISDIVNFKDLKLDFDLGEPFLPFQQLLAVLPAGSKNLLPSAYQELMTSPNSSIIDYYPKDFDTDLNGKQQDWEAVVLIPFIDEKRLLKAMEKCNERLTEEEKNRNKHGPMNVYTYTEQDMGSFKSPEYFPKIVANHASMKEVWREEIAVDISKLQFGLRPGVLQDVYFPGFPTLKHIPHTGSLKKAKVKVFEHAARGESMILTIQQRENTGLDIEELANSLLGNTVYVNWPHMVEARIVGVSNGLVKYNFSKDDNGEKIDKNELDSNRQHQFNMSVNVLQTYYYEKLGVDVGETSIILYGNSMEGRKYVFGSSKKITYDKMWGRAIQPYLFQVCVRDIAVHNPTLKIYQTVEEAFPLGSTVFMLGHPFYGSKGSIADSKETLKNGRLKIVMEIKSDPVIDETVFASPKVTYMPGNTASQRVGISPHLLSRITGSILIDMTDRERPSAENSPKMNIGLNLKFNKKNEEVPGYTKKDNGLWTYSNKAVDLVSEYVEKYPHVIEHLSSNSKSDYFFRTDIFPDPDGVQEVKNMMDWLKAKDYNSIERTECGTEVLDTETIQALEKLIDNFEPKNSLRNIQVKPHLLYKDDLLLGNLPPVPSVHHKLLDRVVSVRSAYTVPAGLRGYIIGIHKAPIQADYQFDILFDKPFPNGMTINSSPHRAYRTSHLTFINISHGERLSQTKTNTVAYAPSVQQAANFNLRTSNRERAGSAFAQWNNMPPKPIEEKDNKFEQLWKNLQAPKPPEDGTDMLKQLLKIDAKPKTEEKPKIEEPVKSFFENVTKNAESINPIKKDGRFDGIKAFLESAQKQPEKSYYAQLFSYFQKKNLGQPRFNFIDVGTKVMAQIRLPDGSVYSGLPCDMKDSACESAALQVLGNLGEISVNSDSLLVKEKQHNQKIIENQNKLEKALKSKESEKPKSEKSKSSGGTRSFYNKNYQRQNLQSLPTPPLQWFGHLNASSFNQPSLQMQHPFYNTSTRNDNSFTIPDGLGKQDNAFLPPWMSNEQMLNPFNKNPDGRNRQNDQPRQNRKNDVSFDKRNQNDAYKKNDRKRDQNESTSSNNQQKKKNGVEDLLKNSESGQKQSSTVQHGKPSTGATEFIPLQAVTKARVRGAIPITPVKQAQDTTKDAVVPTVGPTVSTTNQQTNTTAAKPKRKPRIAANFGNWDPNLC